MTVMMHNNNNNNKDIIETITKTVIAILLVLKCAFTSYM
jgi:hypothetical protein